MVNFAGGYDLRVYRGYDSGTLKEMAMGLIWILLTLMLGGFGVGGLVWIVQAFDSSLSWIDISSLVLCGGLMVMIILTAIFMLISGPA